MVKHVSVKRDNQSLKFALSKILEIRERVKQITLGDSSRIANQTFIFASQFEPMIEIAHVITKGALLRNESRGAHAKDEFPDRNDKEWLKTSIAEYDPATRDAKISYVPVDTRYLQPHLRDYTKASKEMPHFENLPKEIPLPV
jgi:succinate dehydrogenase / fumarate reductase flavoprotein subunit